MERGRMGQGGTGQNETERGGTEGSGTRRDGVGRDETRRRETGRDGLGRHGTRRDGARWGGTGRDEVTRDRNAATAAPGSQSPRPVGVRLITLHLRTHEMNVAPVPGGTDDYRSRLAGTVPGKGRIPFDCGADGRRGERMWGTEDDPFDQRREWGEKDKQEAEGDKFKP